MAVVLGALALTLADWAARLDPNGKVANIVEILNQTNEVIADMLFVEGNTPTGHITTVRTGLPEVAWRMLNYGVPQSKSRTVQVTDTCGMLAAYAQVDKKLADLNGNTAAFRLSEDVAFIEAMNQEMASVLFYGNTQLEPKKFLGLAPRYNDSSAENGENIIDAGGTGSDLTSIWLVCWGASTVHGIFPKGYQAGLKSADLTQNKAEGDPLLDPNGDRYQGYISHYSWDLGLCLRDWRYVVRISNIDINTLTKRGGIVNLMASDAVYDAGPDLADLLIQAIELVPSLGKGTPVIYCNKTIRTWMRRQIKNSTNVNILMQDIAGKKVVTFDEIPVKRCDAILNSEDRVI